MAVATFNYREYLASRDWALKREAVRARSGGVCERCKKAPHQDTHHLTYERIGHERLEDLQGVCRPCHEFLSGKSDADPARVGRVSGELRAVRFSRTRSGALLAIADLQTVEGLVKCIHGPRLMERVNAMTMIGAIGTTGTFSGKWHLDLPQPTFVVSG